MCKKLNVLYIFTSLLISISLYSQTEYKFDYYTVYDYKEHQNSSIITSQEITYSNSKNPSYHLFIKIKNDTVYSAEIRDYLNEKIFIYKDNKHQSNLNEVSLFNTANTYNYDLYYCKRRKKASYQIEYYFDNGKKIINIKRFKNKKKKQLANESFFTTIPSKITKNQHYNFPALTSPLWCEKFKLINDEIISYSYFIENGNEIMHIRELKKIEKIDFTLIINQ